MNKKKLLDFTLEEFVDKLASWIPADGEGSKAPFLSNLDVVKIKTKNLPILLLQPIVAASPQAQDDDKIKDYAKKYKIGERSIRDRENKPKERLHSTYKLNPKILKDTELKQFFSYRLIRESCLIELDESSNISSQSMVNYYGTSDFTKLQNWPKPTETNNSSITVRTACSTFASKFESELRAKSKETHLFSYAKEIFPEEETPQVDEIYMKLVELMLGEEKHEVVPKMSNGNEYSYKKYMEIITTSIRNGAKQIILTGAPGTGKTKMARDIAKKLGTVLPSPDKPAGNEDQAGNTQEDNTPNNYEFVQFHPSYDYTDFVEGLRPVEVMLEVKSQPTEGAQKEAEHQSIAKSEIVFKRVDGTFKSFCRKVIKENKKNEENDENEEEKKKYFFLIDEINRADLSKVFGELMYCLESDKRGKENAVKTPYQNLTTYFPGEPAQEDEEFKNGFYIPDNVYIIGTMNDIDRSVESMDFALRRRFLFMEIKVTKELLEDAFRNKEFWRKSYTEPSKNDNDTSENDINKKINTLVSETTPGDLAARVMKMNEVMKAPAYKDFGLNEQYYISQGQFANLPDNAFTDDSNVAKSVLDFVWSYRIEPLLREYVRGEEEDKVDAFITACENALKGPVGGQNTSKDTANNAQAENGES